MNIKERHDEIKEKMAKLLTEKRMLESRIKEIDEEFENLRKEMLDVKYVLFLEEKERGKRL